MIYLNIFWTWPTWGNAHNDTVCKNGHSEYPGARGEIDCTTFERMPNQVFIFCLVVSEFFIPEMDCAYEICVLAGVPPAEHENAKTVKTCQAGKRFLLKAQDTTKELHLIVGRLHLIVGALSALCKSYIFECSWGLFDPFWFLCDPFISLYDPLRCWMIYHHFSCLLQKLSLNMYIYIYTCVYIIFVAPYIIKKCSVK